MNAKIDGRRVLSEADFHQALICALDMGPYYGKNMDALWDVMTGSLPRPVRLVWRDANTSRYSMPTKFAQIVALLREVEQQDIDYGWTERFELVLS